MSAQSAGVSPCSPLDMKSPVHGVSLLSQPMSRVRRESAGHEMGHLTRGDLVTASPVPAVICLQDVQELLGMLGSDGNVSDGSMATDSAHRQPGANTSPCEVPDVVSLDYRIREYVERYYIDDPENHRALTAVLVSLAGDVGQGFLIHGLYGSGKSHFLSVVSLLSAGPRAWEFFLATHPTYDRIAERFNTGKGYGTLERQLSDDTADREETQHRREPLLVVAVPLDAHRGTREDLEDILFAEAERVLSLLPGGHDSHLSATNFALWTARELLGPYQAELDNRIQERTGKTFTDIQQSEPAVAVALSREFAVERGIPTQWEDVRRERLRRCLDFARNAGRRGVVFVLDEVSLYLSSRVREQFHNDISFLQFLGQQGRYYPLWVVGAAQRGIEETGDIDADTLRKLKDRYIWDISLSMAQMRPVIGSKVLRRRNEEQFQSVITRIWDERMTAGAPPGLDSDELMDIYPLHPLTLECLTQAASRFFSRNRTVIQFVRRVVVEGANRPAGELVGPDEVLRQFWPAIEESPELRPTARALEAYSEIAAEAAPQEPEAALQLVQALAALSIAGIRRTVRELAGAIGLLPPLRGSEPETPAWQRVHALLERLRLRGGYLEVSRGFTPAEDIYSFDSSCDLARLVRRRAAVCEESLSDDDARIFAAAEKAASDNSFPIATLARPISIEVDYLTTRRSALVWAPDLVEWREQDAIEILSTLSDYRSSECLYLLLGRVQNSKEQRERFSAVMRQIPESRWRSGLLAWIPRPLREDELQLLRQYTAFCLLMDDPTLRTPGMGRQILERLRSEKCDRDQEARFIIRQAYREGVILGAATEVAGSSDLMAHATSVERTAGLLASRCLSDIFPDFVTVAPRRRLTGKCATAPLLTGFILPGNAPIRPGSPLDGLIRDVATPLGLVSVDEGVYRLCEPSKALMDVVLSVVPQEGGCSYEKFAGTLGHSSYGLCPEQSELIAAALTRLGAITPCDAAGSPLPLGVDTVAIARHTRYLRRSDIPGAALWERIVRLSQALERPVVEQSLQAQERIWERLQELKRSTLSNSLLSQVADLWVELGSNPESWETSVSLVREWVELLQRVPETASAPAGLAAFLEAIVPAQEEQIKLLYLLWKNLSHFASEEGPLLVRVVRSLKSPDMILPDGSDLEPRRKKLLEVVARGDSILERSTEALRYGQAILQRYREEYLEWHTRLFSEACFAPYRRIMETPGWMAIQRLDDAGIDPGHAAQTIKAACQQALSLQCSSAGLRASLERGAVCPICHLPMGTSIEIPAPSQIQRQIIDALTNQIMRMAQEPEIERLQHHRACRMDERSTLGVAMERFIEILEQFTPQPDINIEQSSKERTTANPASSTRIETQGQPSSPKQSLDMDLRQVLDSLLDDTLCREIQAALSKCDPQPRKMTELATTLCGREMTRVGAMRAFQHWFDPDGSLGPDQFVRFEA